jgi:ATP-dependent DNA ligase
LIFDVLYVGNELLIDETLRERATKLDELLASAKTINHKGHEGTRRRLSQLSARERGAGDSAGMLLGP